MDNQSLYVKGIQSRSTLRFYIGALARIKKYLKNLYSVKIATRRGAIVGTNVSLPYSLAKRANKNLVIGNHVSIQTDRLDLRCSVSIGDYVIIGNDVEIITKSHNVDSPDWEYRDYGIVIEDYVWLATRVLILPTCRKIEYGAVVAAGSVVAKNVERMKIIAGNPPVILRERKDVHYNLCVEGLLGNDLITYWKIRKG